MLDLVICVFASGPNCSAENAEGLVESVDRNIGIDDHRYFVYARDDALADAYRRCIRSRNLHKIVVSSDRYAKQFNDFYAECKDDFRYLIYSHDDVVLDSPGVFSRTMSILGPERDVGWVTYTNHQYTSSGHLMPNSVRTGVHKDRNNYPRVFECRHGSLDGLEYPVGPVHVFGPMSHFNLVSMESMDRIGLCVDWSTTPLLTDEDWALESCIRGLRNIWIPDIFYRHPRPGQKRVADSLRCTGEVFAKFEGKWGVHPVYSEESMEALAVKHPGLRKFRCNSFDWLYL